MNTFLARANTIFAFTLTVLAALTFGCFLTTAFNDHTSTVVINSTAALVYVTVIQMFSTATLKRTGPQGRTEAAVGKMRKCVMRKVKCGMKIAES